MTTPPLSAAAQAVLDAVEQVPVPHGQAFPLIRLEIAAAPTTPTYSPLTHEPTPC